jgi:RHS repeat-associated protein
VVDPLDLSLFKSMFFHAPGPSGINGESNSVEIAYIHNDHLGTPQVMTDATGSVIWRAVYDPFGAAIVDEDVDGDGLLVSLNLRFPGQYYDQESGNFYNYFRDYDPATGRYIQSDPIGLAGGLNTYLYANANPNKYIDPTGELFFVPALPAIGAWLGGTGGAVLGWSSLGLGALGAWAAYNESADDEDCPPVDDDTVEEEYDSLEAAVGSVNPLEDVEYEGKTKNPGLRDQGYTEKWTGIDSDGKYQSAFRNPKTGKWTGGHESSKNNKYW